MARSAAAAALNLRQSRRLSICASSTPIPAPSIVHKRGSDILHDPWFNKVSCCYKRIESEKNIFLFLIQSTSRFKSQVVCNILEL